MKQRILIMVNMPCEKCRTKAMEVAARATGVISIKVAGDYTDRLEVVGDGVDPVCLVKCLRKKLGCAMILEVEEVKDKKPPAKPNNETKPCVSAPSTPQCRPPVCTCYHPHCPPAPQVVVYEDYGACCIM